MENEQKPLEENVPCLWWQYRLKHQYHYTPDDQWESLDDVMPAIFKGLFKANKKSEILKVDTGKIWRPGEYSINDMGYSIFGASTNGICISMPAYSVLSRKFIFNYDPENNIYVDHIINGKENRHIVDLKYLRWVSPSENGYNSRVSSKRLRFGYKIYSEYDKDLKFPLVTIPYVDLTDRELKKIYMIGYRHGGVKNGLRYVRVDFTLEEYNTLYGPPVDREWDPLHPELGGWKKSRFKGVYVNSNGQVKIDGTITVGCKADDGYYVIYIRGNRYRLNRFVAEVFLNKNKKISKKFVVDHLDTDRGHNSVSNLKICTQKENMNNPLTKKKSTKPVSKMDRKTGFIIKTYESIEEATRLEGFPSTALIFRCIKGDTNYAGNYLWSYAGKEKERWEQYLAKIEEKKPLGWWCDKENNKKEASKYNNRQEYKRKNSAAYDQARMKGWLDEFFPSDKKNVPRGWWNIKENCEKEARKYKSRSEFHRNKSQAYLHAKKNGWLDEFFPSK